MASEPLTAEELDRIEDALATCGFGAVEGSIPDLIAAARRCGEPCQGCQNLNLLLAESERRCDAAVTVLTRHAAEAEEAAK